MSECLVIIDVQKGFLTEDTKMIPGKIKELIADKKFDHIVATKFINSKMSPHYIFTHWNGMMDPDSQKLDPYVEEKADRVFDKYVNSCFSEEFLNFICDEKISKLYFVGIDTDCCVLKSAFDCFDRKIPFEVITDCCASTGGSSIHKSACNIMLRNFGPDCVKKNE